jgi:spermidine dehydrogenase
MKHKWNDEDRALGMDRQITRRDFLNGVALTIGAALLPAGKATANLSPETKPDYYPPALTGLRGNHEGSYEVAHQLRDATFWEKAGPIADTGEAYDLVIVGGGISGLSAAHFYRQHAGSKTSILILENHDDFGGHAKRNEFHENGRTILGFGGGWSIDSPAPYSAVAKGLIRELGIDVSQWPKVVDPTIYKSRGLQSAVFFDKETFGTDRLVPFSSDDDWDYESRANKSMWPRFFADAPLSDQAKQDLKKVFTENKDYMPGLTSAQKKARLARMSYSDFLTKIVKVNPQVVQFFQTRPHGLYGVGIEAVPAQDAWGLGFPGFQGMKLNPSFGKGMNRDSMRYDAGGDAYFFHFPDGNATIARLLVRRLIPEAIPGHAVEDIVTARCDYSQLDSSKSSARIRLNSTVVRVKHLPSRKEVEITYMHEKKLQSVRAKRCILACWNAVIPYICPELPDGQKEDLAYEIKVPLVYTNVLINNWQAFAKAQVRDIQCPGAYHSWVTLDMPVSIGNYHCANKPDEPIVIHMMRVPCSPGLPARSQHRAGRFELFSTKFETFERNIRDQLSRMLGPYGFDSAKNIRAITVNRWAHGYAYQYNSLFDPFWLEGTQPPCERARKPFGRIAIANADAGAYSYMDGAIDQAHRAVREILAAG